jgi:hypothetical protein
MPLYFFHIRHPDLTIIEDEEGGEFFDFQAAKYEATQSLRDIAAEELKHGAGISGYSIEIGDVAGMVVGKVHARELLV